MSVLASVVIVVLLAGLLVFLLQFLPVDPPFLALARGLILFAVVFYIVMVLFGFAPPVSLPVHR